MPIASETSHQTAATRIVVVVAVAVGADRRDRPQRRRLGAGDEDGDAQQVGVGHPLLRQPLEDRQPALRPVDDQVGLFGQLRRRLRGDDADADRGRQLARLAQLAQAAEGVEVGAVVAGVDGGGRAASPASSEATAASLPPPPTGRSSSTLRPQRGSSPAWPASTAISWAQPSACASSVGAAPVQRLDRPLVLEPQPGARAAARGRARR